MFGVQWDLVLAFMHNKGNIADNTLTSNSTTIGNYRDSVFQLSQTGQYTVCSNYSLSSTWNPSTTSTTNFVDSSRNKIAQSSDGNGILVTTGTSETNKVMNIYDIAGNVYEWTLEKTSDTDSPRASRGGLSALQALTLLQLTVASLALPTAATASVSVFHFSRKS